MTQLKILLLSAYDAGSHRYWHQQLTQQFPQHNWHVLSLKDRYFAWRMGANAFNFKAQYHDLLKQQYDRIIATSMTDLSTLIALYPHLASSPKHLYFHENQFAYPINHQQQGLKEIQLRSMYAACVADKLWFNSEYNRSSFMTGIKDFIDQMPDGIPNNLIPELRDKSAVLPVPILNECYSNECHNDECQALVQATSKHQTNNPNTTQVIWNHRWEHDKGPETLLALMRLCGTHHDIKFHILGQRFRKIPKALKTIVDEHQDQCLTLGFVESRKQYIKILQQADVVLSTAHHEFQGIAMLEAVACGCLPVAPNNLVYPELYPSENLYPSTPDDADLEAQAIYQLLRNSNTLQTPIIDHYWSNLKAHYEQLIHS